MLMEKKQIVNIISDQVNKSPGIEFEVFISDEKVLSIEIKDGQVDHFRSSRELGLALRVVRNGRLGFAYLFGSTPDGVAQLADRAVELAGQADYDALHSFPAEASLEVSDLGTFDARLSSIGKKEKIEYVKEMDSSALSLDPRIKRVRKAEYEERTCFSSIVNSQDLDLEKKETHIDMALMAIAERMELPGFGPGGFGDLGDFSHRTTSTSRWSPIWLPARRKATKTASPPLTRRRFASSPRLGAISARMSSMTS